MNAPVLAVIPNYVNYLLWQPASSVTVEEARRQFVKRFGFEPAEITEDNVGRWAGPAPVPVAKSWVLP